MVAVKVYKKSSPNGKITVYLNKRDAVDHLSHVEPIEGVVMFDHDALRGRKLYACVTTTFRFGREQDETMGLKFSKEMVLFTDQIYPGKQLEDVSEMQTKLAAKLDGKSHPFRFTVPSTAPCSVTLQPGTDDVGKPLGVEYNFQVFMANSSSEKPRKRSSVSMAIRKVQYAPIERGRKLPSGLVSKSFTLSPGKLSLEVNLDSDIYYHGEKVGCTINISNNSKKTVKNIKVGIIQHCEVTMVNSQYTKTISMIQTTEGCPVTPGAALNKQYVLCPSSSGKRGIALDGRLRDEDANLASSTMVAEGKSPSDAVGIVVSYSLRVTLNCGALAGELVADIPFKLLHPIPGSEEAIKARADAKARAIEGNAGLRKQDSEANIVFEDFKRQRTIDLE